MAKASFTDWQLSSSDSEEECKTKGVLLTVKNDRITQRKRKNTAFDSYHSEKYISLTDRLKMRQITELDSCEDDEELPAFGMSSTSHNAAEKISSLHKCESPISLSSEEEMNNNMENHLSPLPSDVDVELPTFEIPRKLRNLEESSPTLCKAESPISLSSGDHEEEDFDLQSGLLPEAYGGELDQCNTLRNLCTEEKNSALYKSESPISVSSEEGVNQDLDCLPSLLFTADHISPTTLKSSKSSDVADAISTLKKPNSPVDLRSESDIFQDATSQPVMLLTAAIGKSKSCDKNVTSVNKEISAAARRRKEMNEHLKTLKPEECLKYMTCEISSSLLSMFEKVEFDNELRKDFVAEVCVKNFDIPCVRWQRKVILTSSDTNNQITEYHDEPEMMVLISSKEFVKMVSAGMDSDSSELTPSSWVQGLQCKHPSVNLHLVCIGLGKYTKSQKAKEARNAKKSKTGDDPKRKNKKSSIPDVSSNDIEVSLVDLQLKCKVMVTCIEEAEELILMIKQLTKAIGEAPYKRMKRQDIQFINEIPSVKINVKTGEGMRKAWGQMIQQFHKVTSVMATAITDRYPTMASLLQAYEGCGSDTGKAEMLLADIPVRRGIGTLQTSRRIGPELSHKIYKLLVSCDPNEKLY